ncbi:recombinase family protein [Streptomyces sp. NPDC014983]|uniref:recombinase family protein n=1 Tax=Streptomyces sp. NPDC014983 TaxID=3364933 RepID=UPI0037026D7C
MASRMFGPPIDLSELDHTPHRTRRPVFLGRVSTKDQQNPASSIPRQVALAAERLEEGEEFCAYYWDIESGMLPPEQRGLGAQEMYDALAVPIPRHGGLQDLVDRAEQLGITHVLAERSDRLARAMLTSLTVEHELGRLSVQVVYANEPTGGTESGQLRMRRYSQVEAEVYRATMLEMSTGGQIQHAVAGYNHGRPPYPYNAVTDPDAPVRGQGPFGPMRPKKRLAPHPDPRRFDAARELCRLRREEHLTGGQIVEILSEHPDRYPVEGRWTWSHVEALIANPKLSGYQVYNRKATRTGRPGHSRINPVSAWVWSPKITHEPVISLEEWREAQVVTAELRRGTGRGLLQIRAAARQRGLDFATISRTGAHTIHQIGEQRIVLPHPVPDALAAQVIADIGRGR